MSFHFEQLSLGMQTLSFEHRSTQEFLDLEADGFRNAKRDSEFFMQLKSYACLSDVESAFKIFIDENGMHEGICCIAKEFNPLEEPVQTF